MVDDGDKDSDNDSEFGADRPLHEPVDQPNAYCTIQSVRLAQKYIELISQATLDNGNLSDETKWRLRNPPEEPVDISDPDTRLSLDLFLATVNASEAVYNASRDAIFLRWPACSVLSYYAVKELVADITGISPVYDDMCVNSCLAFTGPFEADLICSTCGEHRYDQVDPAKKIPRKQFQTIPLGLQLQALWRSTESAESMGYRTKKMEEVLAMMQALEGTNGEDIIYDDIFCGSEFIELHEQAGLTPDDVVIATTFDGSQLYKNKQSDTWTYAWLVDDFNPKIRFRKVHIFPGAVIPGPNKPKHIDSFLFRGVHHVSALQRENNGRGLRVWNVVKQQTTFSRPAVSVAMADAVGIPEVDGSVGHHGAHGCRLRCKTKGRHKGAGHYFAAHMKPIAYNVQDCNHEDVDIRNLVSSDVEVYQQDIATLVASRDKREYERNRKMTGLSKPTIFSGLVSNLMVPVPRCWVLDLMHLIHLNIPDLFIKLWRGTIKCEPTDKKSTWTWATLTGDTWISHGKLIAKATPHFPSSFHRPPRNPAEKINSGYKATEFYLYFYSLGPAHFRGILPKEIWRNFCRLVHGVRIILQRSISGAQLQDAHSTFIQFVEEYETLYYQRRVDRLHFCRPSLHTLLHTASEVTRVGPGAYTTQFAMERTIGNLGQEVRQASNPFSNLSQRALLRCQINALKSMCPELDAPNGDGLRNSHPLPNHYVLLRAKDRYPYHPTGIIANILENAGIQRVTRWARVLLPNGQIARSAWKETKKALEKVRISRNVKVVQNGQVDYAEVQFYFLRKIGDNIQGFAIISRYSRPDATLLEESFGTLWSCTYLGDNALEIIPLEDITAVVSMQPLPLLENEEGEHWFAVEKSGIEDIEPWKEPVVDEE
ncbi:hypothetical protein BDN71DRAFT_1388425 [Pleurotus eryngii]|uniref:Transposase n=1 Tax=Pleurotus eryngii TaxID=5323 RepID=A0A9P6A2E2_PLEER|nr:hypothetical protein BDN71DRAFT_1388425 [Pleurotus eryngii]